VITSHNYNRCAVIVMAFMLLSSAALSLPRPYRPAAAESTADRRDSNPKYLARTSPVPDSKRMTAWVDGAYGKLPIRFEANLGQTDSRVKFISRGSGSTLFLTSNGAVLAVKNSANGGVNEGSRSSSRKRVATLRMSMIGANPAAEITGLGRLSGNSNYFRGSDPSKWQSNVPTYARVEYRELYPGVNLVYYGNEQQLEYDFQVAPGGNPGDIRMAFEGVRKVTISADGDLILRASGSDIRMHKPSIYQETNGTRQSIAGRYVVRGKRQIAFEVDDYDKSKALVIDPVLSYSTFLGGTGYDYGRSIAVDSAGNAYITGQTTSFNFPVTINAYDTTYANGYDVFVTKLNASGSAMVYSTYLGGNSDDIGYGIAIDSSGNAYVTGMTVSTAYPTTPGAFQTTLQGSSYNGGDAFVTKLNADGTALVYSTYLGGTNVEQANGIAIDSAGNAYVAGFTYSSNFPTTPGAFQTSISTGSSSDAFVTELNTTGTALVYSTFLGGTGADQATAIKVDAAGSAYITGMTTSTNFDITPGAYQTTYAGSPGGYYATGDAFVTKFDPAGTSLVYSTYLGGTGDDGGFGIDLSNSGEAYVAGSTGSGDFPTTPGVVRVGNGGMAKSANGADSWFASNSGLISATELSLAINPSSPSTVFVGSSGVGVFKSTNGGSNWTAVNSGLTDLTIKALTIDPTATSIIYLGTNTRGVFRSTDSGATWRAINTGQNGMSVNTVKIDPVSSSIIYAGTDSGISKSTNGGASWINASSGLNQVYVNDLAIDPVATSTIYAGLAYGGVFKSTNSGATWSATSLTPASIRSVLLDPLSHSTVYAGTDNGVQKSTDSGASWTGVNTGLSNRNVNALTVSPADSSTIYAATQNGVFKSTNGGMTWAPRNNGLAGAVVNALAIDPSNAATIYCGSAAGSTDAFVTKLNSSGSALSYSTYLGGISGDQAASISVDASGNAYVTGNTASQNFPTTAGGFQFYYGYSNDGFVTKLDPTAAALVYSTYLGGSDYDYAYSVVADASGSAYVTGTTQSQNFPTTPGSFQPVRTGNYYYADGFVSKLAVTPTLTSDLGITMTASTGPFVAGSYLTYNITVTNNGPEPTSSVLVTDQLPPSLIFSNCNSSYYNCSHSGNTVTFPISLLEVGATANMQVSVVVSCAIASSVMIDNTVTVESNATDPNPSDNSATATISATNPGIMISPTSQVFPRGGGSGYVSVNAGGGCTWTSMSDDSWITITYSSNCCNGNVNYTVAQNPGAPRSGTMTIAGQLFTVNQEGCVLTLDQDHQSFAANAGTGTVNVTATAGCAWTAGTGSSFIHITSGSSGTGNGAVQYSVDANAGATNRSDTITIAGQTFTVYQGINFLDVPPSNPFYDDIGKLAARGVTLGCGNGNYCPNDPITREQMAAFILRAKGEFSPPIPPSQRFTDVPPGNQFYNFIDRLAVLQITLGCTPDHLMYCPADPVKRDQMSAFILRGLGEFNPPTPGSQRFTDVPPSNVFYNSIDRMAVLNITLGCTPDHLMYCPNVSVTRGQMAAFLVRAFGL
jgi:uncharacterized repeat protein (TIGR01451 family)